MENDILLAIETAVEGGSLSLISNRRIEIDGWSGTTGISKAEDVLEQIANLLKKNGIEKTQIKLIGVSKGAGSLTGEKIGLALAKGLARSLNSRVVAVSIFEALLSAAGNKPSDGNYLTALPSGKNQVRWQRFTHTGGFFLPDGDSHISSSDDFLNVIKDTDSEVNILASSLQKYCGAGFFENNLKPVIVNRLATITGLSILHEKRV